MKPARKRTKWPLWQQYLVAMSVAAALAVVAGIVWMVRSADELEAELADEPIAQLQPRIEGQAQPVGNTATDGDGGPSPRLPPKPHADHGGAKGDLHPDSKSSSPPADAVQSGAKQSRSAQTLPTDGDPSENTKQGRETTRPIEAGKSDRDAVATQPKAAEKTTAVKPADAGVAAAENNSWLKLDEHGEPCQVTLANGTVLALETYGDEYEGYDYRPPITLYDPSLKKLIDFKYVHGHGNGAMYLNFDSKRDRMYWVFQYPPHRVARILSANLNGQDITDLVTDMENIFGFTIDPQRNKMYWTERTALVDSVKRANLDGSGIEEIVPGAEGSGMAVEPASGDIFYWTHEGTLHRSINRIKSDGSGEKKIISDVQVVGTARQLIAEPTSRRLYWNILDGSSMRRANYDGSDAKFVVDLPGHGNFALDMGDKKVYWTSSVSELCRANLDGSQTEKLVVSPPAHQNPETREFGYVAFEPERRWIYISWHYFEGAEAISVVSRMEVPQPLKPSKKPAPPWIEGVSPATQAAGGEVIVKGKGFKDASKVALFDDGNGHEVEAVFDVHSDSELSLTMPELSEGCAYVALIVLTPGGVTVTIPTATSLAKPNLWVPLPGQLEINTDLVTGKYANIWYVLGQRKRLFNVMSQETKTYNGGGIRSLIYAEDGSLVGTKERGNNVLFMKNGAITGMSRWRTVIYHEPFARIGNSYRKSADETQTTLVPVPAIRPSFLAELLQYQQAGGDAKSAEGQ